MPPKRVDGAAGAADKEGAVANGGRAERDYVAWKTEHPFEFEI